MKWENLFDPRILQRGLAYQRGGAVMDLEADDDQITAVVEGSEEYEVTIELDGGRVADMECTCPYAEGGSYCKHMAAVLYAWEAEGRVQVKEKTADTLKACVEQADEGLVRRFLLELLKKDKRQRLRFMAEAAPERSEDRLRMAAARVDEVVDRYTRRGFIEYREARGFTRELEAILDDAAGPLLEQGRDQDVFRLSAHLFLALDGVEIDDSDGGMSDVAYSCQELWNAVLERADEALKREIYDWLLWHCGGRIDDYLEDFCEETLFKWFDAPEYLEKKLEVERAALDEELAKDRTRDYTADSRARGCLRLMEQLEKPEEAFEDFAKRYWRLSAVREYVIEKYRREARWDEAVKLLKECIAKDGGDALVYHRQLKDAYAQLGLKDEYRRELWLLVTRLEPAKLEHYHEYKALFTVDEWQGERERLIEALPARAFVAPLFNEEKLYDRLLERALATDGLGLLRTYESVLLERWPDKVLEKYAREVEREAGYASQRAAYQALAEMLRHMKLMPGGEAVVKQIVAQWRVAYRRRRAMMEELEGL